jgi:hypothetical protein
MPSLNFAEAAATGISKLSNSTERNVEFDIEVMVRR